jgi:hypothetical protein
MVGTCYLEHIKRHSTLRLRTWEVQALWILNAPEILHGIRCIFCITLG